MSSDLNEQGDSGARLEQIRRLVDEFMSRRAAGEQASDETLIRSHPELMPELAEELLRQAEDAGSALHEAKTKPQVEEHGTRIVTPGSADTDNCPAEAAQPVASNGNKPDRIGRYKILSILGEGGFGSVYLAYDDDLERSVAVKVPHPELVQAPADIEAFLAEARVLASLEHNNIVPVYDVGRTEDKRCFVVSKLIEGSDLAAKMQETRLGHYEAAELVRTVATALHHAHQKGLVHRDIKPSNILIDTSGQPYVTDFGLALREGDFGTGPKNAGTPAYMSPEQARGEGHRVDGRSDIFSLGVVLYELLTGRRPFRGGSQLELLMQIWEVEARPPRQIDDTIPRELERVCLKALSKRVVDRYTTAKDFADDLAELIQKAVTVDCSAATSGAGFATPPGSVAQRTLSNLVARTDVIPSGPGSELQLVKVVPKGLRSFDANDGDFFLGLLPGPRDRYGLPDSIRFWKLRIEQVDLDATFAVGLIYGPSGCGKSSLVKAGLLPNLANHVRTVYLEATPHDTEVRLLKGLRKQCPDLPAELDLLEALTAIRRGQGTSAGEKLLIVLDQFEQWLHANREQQSGELTRALRQCDGGRVQCVVMVRDDFWMAATRFLQELEVRLVEGENSAAVDLFDLRHAEKVLTAFGRAFGVLPASLVELSSDQKSFLEQAVSGLAQEGKVICVRLALFAEMIKGKTWTPAALREVGGTEGIRVTFLEETFSVATAPPQHRLHQKAARAVLKALLPETGTGIKGNMRSYQQLFDASGYDDRPGDFDDLIRILDSEIRLITPTDPGAVAVDSDSTVQVQPGQKYYQLTHDYLVPSLREWLTGKQRETNRGRAELRLTEQSALWNAKPENRRLPTWWEWLTIRVLTDRNKWTDPQHRMMRRSARHHGLRGSVVLALALSVFVGALNIHRRFVDHQNETRAQSIVRQLLVANIEQVPGIVRELDDCRKWANPLLQRELRQAVGNPDRQLRASLGFLAADDGQIETLYAFLLSARPEQVSVIRDMLSPQKHELTERLWSVLEQTENGNEADRIRAACALARFDPENQRWDKVTSGVVANLLSVRPAFLAYWKDALRPVSRALLDSLRHACKDRNRSEFEKALATDVLADYAANEPDVLASALLDADESQFVQFFAQLQSHREHAETLLESTLRETPKLDWKDEPIDPDWESPQSSVVRKIETAHGIVHRQFAFVQLITLDGFATIAQQLKASGYRPKRFRPFSVGDSLQVAAVWTRDGRDWEFLRGTSDEISKKDVALRERSYRPVDVAGYLTSEAGNQSLQYAALWVKQEESDVESRIYVGVDQSRHATSWRPLRDAQFSPIVYCVHRTAHGMRRYSAVWAKPGPPYRLYGAETTEYSGQLHPEHVQVDVQVAPVPTPVGSVDRYRNQLILAENRLQRNDRDLTAWHQKANADFHLQLDEQLLQDVAFLLENCPNRVMEYHWRSIVHARLGKAKEAKDDLARFREVSSQESVKAYVDAVVSAYLSEHDEGMERLEAAIAKHADQSGFLYNAACAYAVASNAFGESDVSKATEYADRAIMLLEQAVAFGFTGYYRMLVDADLDALRTRTDFRNIIDRGKVDRHYSAVWLQSKTHTSVEIHGLAPVEHLARCRELMSQGYRPASISTIETSPGEPLLTASVWQRPLASQEDKEELASRQANAALALLRMGQSDTVWPLLAHSPDPRTRSFLIHRAAQFGVDPQRFVDRLNEEQEVSTRRALILCLGEYDSLRLSGKRDNLIEQMVEVYQNDADSGLHAAAEWLLRRLGQQTRLGEIDDTLKERQVPWANGNARDRRQWYVNSQGHTMVVIPAGPAPEKVVRQGLDRSRVGEWAGPTFAISSKEVTRGQYTAFRKERPSISQDSNIGRFSRTDDSPQLYVGWYDAAAYCNWLSGKEKIPEDQWCYIPDANGRYAQGMRTVPNYQSRSGYRLPTDAEWEFSCRSGTVTTRYYGRSEQLLPKYAWYQASSQNRTWPVGLLKPNDFGLFDMYGNALEWCHDFNRNAGNSQFVQDKVRRRLRGNSYYTPADNVRSGYRYTYSPFLRIDTNGFRVARSLPTSSPDK